MPEFKKILFACDLTAGSKAVMDYALSIADKYQSRVTVLHVVRNLKEFRDLYVPFYSLKYDQNRLLAGAKQALDRLFQAEFDACPDILKRVVTGEAVPEILKQAAADASDLIVMGTNGRKGVEKTVLGSVSHEVAQQSTVPVLIVNTAR